MVVTADEIDDTLEHTKDRETARKRRNNAERYKRHLRRLANLHYIGCGAYYDKRKGRCVKYYRGSMSKYYKHMSAKKVRRFKGIVKSGAGYRKVFDFWWSLW